MRSERLRWVAERLAGWRVADIGTDHALLPIALANRYGMPSGVATEVARAPFERAREAVAAAGLSGQIEVRLGDGLAPIQPGEVEALSICGMGGERMANILRAHPERISPRVVLQPNDGFAHVRRWALEAGFHLREEVLLDGPRPSRPIAAFVFEAASGPDPAYTGLDLEAALYFGPLLLASKDPKTLAWKTREEERLGEVRAKGGVKYERGAVF